MLLSLDEIDRSIYRVSDGKTQRLHFYSDCITQCGSWVLFSPASRMIHMDLGRSVLFGDTGGCSVPSWPSAGLQLWGCTGAASQEEEISGRAKLGCMETSPACQRCFLILDTKILWSLNQCSEIRLKAAMQTTSKLTFEEMSKRKKEKKTQGGYCANAGEKQ